VPRSRLSIFIVVDFPAPWDRNPSILLSDWECSTSTAPNLAKCLGQICNLNSEVSFIKASRSQAFSNRAYFSPSALTSSLIGKAFRNFSRHNNGKQFDKHPGPNWLITCLYSGDITFLLAPYVAFFPYNGQRPWKLTCLSNNFWFAVRIRYGEILTIIYLDFSCRKFFYSTSRQLWWKLHCFNPRDLTARHI